MIEFRRSEERGFEDKGRLKSHHTFSFENYMDPKFLGFRTIRVLNEDILAPGKGYGEQFHRDIEILTYVVEGAVECRDSLGNTSVIRPGEVQRLTAGTGIYVELYNLSHHEPAHLFQFWIQTSQNNLPPSIEQKIFNSATKWGQWCLLASNNGRAGSIIMHQDVDIYASILDKDDELIFDALNDRAYWIQVVSGSFRLNDVPMKKGDGASLVEELSFVIKCDEGGELLLFDLA